jgi:hypothetical protein
MLRRVTVRAATGLAAAWFAGVVWFTSDGGVSVYDLFIVFYGGGAIFLTWLIAIAVLAIRKLTIPWIPFNIAASLVIAGAAVLFTDRAIDLRLVVSRSALGRYVADATSRGRAEKGVRVGAFFVREVEVLPDGVVRIITADCGLADDCGLTYSPHGRPPVIGEDRYTHLTGRWWHWWRSW